MRLGIGAAVSGLVLLATVAGAGGSSYVWYRTAEQASQTLAGTINGEIVRAVGKELSTAVAQAEAAHGAIRTLFLQNVLETREADKREFVFLAQLQSQITVSWIVFGWPDGDFFAARKAGDGRIEMMEISHADHPGQRRVDTYKVVTGDIEFESRRFDPTGYTAPSQNWFVSGMAAERPAWLSVPALPGTSRPTLAYAGPIDVYQERQGVLGIVIDPARLSRFLSQLSVGRTGAAFILGPGGNAIAAPDPEADEIHPARLDHPLLPVARAALAADAGEARNGIRRRLSMSGELYEAAASELPLEGWSLVTVIPEAEFLGPIEQALLRVLLLLGGLTAAGALLSAFLARRLFVRPLLRVFGELNRIERFELEAVRPHASRLREMEDLSRAIADMAKGLSAFGKFIPAGLVRNLLREGVAAEPGGEIRLLTVMFVDIAGFTGLSERLGNNVVPLLSAYLDIISRVVTAHGGTIDKFIGDAVMAFWGAPSPSGDHAAACCHAALDCAAAIAASGLRDDRGVPLRIRIGINTGDVLVGNIGSELRLNYTVIGDAVNVASRLEAANKHFGTTIIAGPVTVAAAAGTLAVRELDEIAVHGRNEGLPVFEVLGPACPERPSWVIHYEQGLAALRSGAVARAMQAFDAALRLRPGDGPATLMMERCRDLLAHPAEPQRLAPTRLGKMTRSAAPFKSVFRLDACRSSSS